MSNFALFNDLFGLINVIMKINNLDGRVKLAQELCYGDPKIIRSTKKLSFAGSFLDDGDVSDAQSLLNRLSSHISSQSGFVPSSSVTGGTTRKKKRLR